MVLAKYAFNLVTIRIIFVSIFIFQNNLFYKDVPIFISLVSKFVAKTKLFLCLIRAITFIISIM